MAEIEFGGMTFKGGKMFAVATAIMTLVGALYGAFEVYKDYTDMKAQILSYTAPDMSGIEKELAVQKETMQSLTASVDGTRDSSTDLYGKLDKMEDRINDEVDKVESLSRSVDDRTAATQRELRDDVYALEEKVNDRLRVIDQDLRDTRKDLEEKIQLILDNPLNDVE